MARFAEHGVQLSGGQQRADREVRPGFVRAQCESVARSCYIQLAILAKPSHDRASVFGSPHHVLTMDPLPPQSSPPSRSRPAHPLPTLARDAVSPAVDTDPPQNPCLPTLTPGNFIPPSTRSKLPDPLLPRAYKVNWIQVAPSSLPSTTASAVQSWKSIQEKYLAERAETIASRAEAARVRRNKHRIERRGVLAKIDEWRERANQVEIVY